MIIEDCPNIIAFTKVALPYGWLGNMSPYPTNGFRTSEACFQAYRFAAYDSIIDDIKAAKSPMQAKLIAKGSAERMIIQPLSDQDINLMASVIKMKLRDNPEMVDMLKETCDKFIIEDETNRKNRKGSGFWGMILENGLWKGENHLGNIWMKIREELK